MKRWWLVPALILLAARVAAVQVTDDRGTRVTVDRIPQRIVSLLPSLTETVCELGACAKLVGVDRYSNFPASVRKLPKAGGGMDPNVETIVSLRPDLVLVATSSRVSQQLEALGLKVIALEPRNAADVRRTLEMLGQVLQVPDAQRVWREIDSGIDAVARSLPPTARGTRVYFEVGRGPYAAGTDSFIGELMQRLGLRNIVGPELGPFPLLNPEFVVRADPDVILIGRGNAEGLEQRPGWARMRALRDGHLCIFDEAQNDVLVRPGPRMAEAARLLAQCVTTKGHR
jgi:iron complex transport system substrate-binding protein